MVNFTNTQSRLFLTTIDLYRKRSKNTFEKLYNTCEKIQIDGLYTYPISGPRISKYGNKLSGSRYRGTDIFDQCGVMLLLNDQYYKGRFEDMKESKITFNTDEDTSMRYILMYGITIVESLNDFQLAGSFTFVIETVLPDIDIISSKLMV